MAKCKEDIRKDIEDQIKSQLPLGETKFFRHMPNGDILVNQKRFQENPAQAYRVVESYVNKLNEAFKASQYGEVVSIKQWDDALQLQIHPPARLVSTYLNNYRSLREREDAGQRLENERRMGISPTGDSDTNLMSVEDEEDYFSPDEVEEELEAQPPAVGTYAYYLRYKENMLATLNQRLARIRSERRKATGNEAELKRLNDLYHQINTRIKGSEERNIIGLEKEIAILKSNPNEAAVASYMQADLGRLEVLAKSTDPSDVEEARKIINFISKAGNFVMDVESGLWKPEEDNPFFDEQALYFEGAIAPFRAWKDYAKSFEDVLKQRGQEFIVEQVNSNSQVQKLNENPLDYKEIISDEKGLKDANWIDMWVMDITNGVWSHNGYIPQVMASILDKAIDEKLNYAREVEHKLNNLSPQVVKILWDMKDENGNHPYRLSTLGILGGVKGVNYGLFQQKTETGLETGKLVNRYSDKFFKDRAYMENEFNRLYEEARMEDDIDIQRRKYAKAFNHKKTWYLHNVIMLDISKVPEIINHADLQDFKEHFTTNSTEAEEYKANLINIIGEDAYREEVAKQIDLIKNFKATEESFVQSFLTEKEVDSIEQLSERDKAVLQAWHKRRSPFYGTQDFFNRDGISIGGNRTYNFMEYNITIPRKTTIGVRVGEDNKHTFHPLRESASTGYWDKNYSKIAENPVLKEFHTVLQDVFKTVRDNMPEHLYHQTSMNSIPALRKSIIEMLFDKNVPILNRLIKAYREFWKRFKEGLGVIVHGDVSYANVDVITGKPNYEVNDSFFRGNTSKISDGIFLETQKFLNLLNSKPRAFGNFKGINKGTSIDLSKINVNEDEDVLIALADYLHVNPTIEDIKRVVGGNSIPISAIIRDAVVHEIVQQQSFDLPKVAKFMATLTMEYAGRNQALPILQTMKEHYESIKNPETNKVGSPLINFFTGKGQTNGLRNNAIQQMNDWFNRVALGNYEKKEIGVAEGEEDTASREDLKDHVKHYAQFLTGQKIGLKYRTREERKLVAEIDKVLENLNPEDEQSASTISRLQKMRRETGRVFAISAAIENFLNFTRFRSLGYNLSAAVTNFLDGFNSNIILASSGEFFPPDKIWKGYQIVRNNFLLATPSLGYKKTKEGKKLINIMEKYRILQDSSNELQKSSVKTNFSWTRKLSPYDLVRRVEFINQSPLTIAMLDSTMIKDKDGNESSVWEALGTDGNLLPQFKTEENIDNWEQMSGNQFTTFKGALSKAIIRGHGNYSDRRGMMIKSSAVGKALMMFKTWVPHALYSRFAKEQTDLASGLPTYKGRFRSFTPASGAAFGAIAGVSLLGPLAGIPIGFLGGAAFARFKGAQSNVGFLRDMANTGLQLCKKMLGMPVNFIAGREIIKETSDFSKYVGGKFTEQDARNMRSNIADMAMLASWILLTLLAKAAFYDDDDEVDENGNIVKAKDTTKRRIHNVLVNRFTLMISQAEMFISPDQMYSNTLGSIGVVKFYQDVKETCRLFDDYAQGDDTIIGGIHSGESKFINQATKTFVPGMFRDGKALTFGFGSQFDQEFPEAKKFPLNKYFHSEEYEAQKEITQQRAERRKELSRRGFEDTEVEEIVKREFGKKRKHESYRDYRGRLERRQPKED